MALQIKAVEEGLIGTLEVPTPVVANVENVGEIS